MALAADGRGRSSTDWVTWKVFDEADGSEENVWLDRLRLDLFRFLAVVATVGLALIVIRHLLLSEKVAWADLANAIFFLLLLLLVSRRPGWLRSLTWLGLAACFANAVIGLNFHSNHVVVATHMLLPLLVLYAALLGDKWMGIVATVGVLAFYLEAALEHWPLTPMEIRMLTNLSGMTILIGLCTFGVRWQHRRFAEAHKLQAENLRRELDARLRLNAILFHDIRNPLTALSNAAELAEASPGSNQADIKIVEEMADRIRLLIDSAKEIDSGYHLRLSDVPVEHIWDDLESAFKARLAVKEQTLIKAGDGRLAVKTHCGILCGSVFGNILGNAVKFSPRGSLIELAASAEDRYVRVEVRNCGDFPQDVLGKGSRGVQYVSHPGTEGEKGHAQGLRIASFCLWRLGGRLEIRRQPDGRVSVAAVMPRGEKTA